MAKSNKQTKYLTCTNPECNKKLAETNFYNSKSPLFPNGKVNICKNCIKEMIDYSDMETIYAVFRILDIPFFYNRWEEACRKTPKNPFGNYIRMANSGLNEFKGARWKDSAFKEEKSNHDEIQDIYKIEDIEKDLLKDFKPTKEMLIKWGTKYNPEQYIKLENFYTEMMEKNNIETPQDMDYLKKISVISMKIDEELEAGHYAQAKQLGDLFSKYMADSKFRAMDKTDADKTGGIRNFSTIYAEVESDGFIPPWEYYRKIKGLSQDIIDKCIMHMENFTLKLNRAEKMTDPPYDTPKLTQEETTEDISG
ncbi:MULTISPECIES: hypothetical protein [unclassified Clostridium]|uniref:hypothetical protein n=1 Tax=unclassified Clostridium TaxID=2614128 RepID=UPI0025BBC9BE|nr:MULTISPECIES: hypothetical protein [unclassified Clostridium]